MPFYMLSLILIPVMVWLWARKGCPQHLWLITGLSFGVVVYPFLSAATVPLIYLGKFGQAILHYSNPLTLFHRWPGKVIYSLLIGHASLSMKYMLWSSAINACIWSVIYGLIGWYIDYNPARNVIRVLIVLFAAPFVFWGVTIMQGIVVVSNKYIHKSNYGDICVQVFNSDDENSEVVLGIGSFNKGYVMLIAKVGRQICRDVDISKAPFQVILGSPQSPPDKKRIALDIPISGGGKVCIGLYPNIMGASGQSTDWSAKVINCTP